MNAPKIMSDRASDMYNTAFQITNPEMVPEYLERMISFTFGYISATTDAACREMAEHRVYSNLVYLAYIQERDVTYIIDMYNIPLDIAKAALARARGEQ